MNGLEPSWTLTVVAVRLAAMMALLPGIGGAALSWRLRGVLVVALAAAAAPLIVASGVPLACGAPSWGQLGGQAFFGALVGGAIRAFVVALAMVGQWLSELSGLGVGAAAAWHADVEGGPLSQLFGWLALLVFLAIDGPYLAIAAVAETLAVPLPGASSAAELAQLAATVLDQSFELSLRVGSPILAALTVATIAVAAASAPARKPRFPGSNSGSTPPYCCSAWG